jgi:hypothetical protein
MISSPSLFPFIDEPKEVPKGYITKSEETKAVIIDSQKTVLIPKANDENILLYMFLSLIFVLISLSDIMREYKSKKRTMHESLRDTNSTDILKEELGIGRYTIIGSISVGDTDFGYLGIAMLSLPNNQQINMLVNMSSDYEKKYCFKSPIMDYIWGNKEPEELRRLFKPKIHSLVKRMADVENTLKQRGLDKKQTLEYLKTEVKETEKEDE